MEMQSQSVRMHRGAKAYQKRLVTPDIHAANALEFIFPGHKIDGWFD
jgi:hypothetical protein